MLIRQTIIGYRCTHSFTFFLYRSGDHRDLHSFPTRRSSDLEASVEDGGNRRGRRPLRPRAARVAGAEDSRRSEEHTSELQSPMYLVCRLLLEKKKIAEWKQFSRSSGVYIDNNDLLYVADSAS